MVETIKGNKTTTVEPEVKAVEPTPVVVVADTPEQLCAKIAVAGAAGDVAEVMRLGNLLKKYSVDIQKAEAAKLLAEATAMAGEREKLALAIQKAVKGVIDISQLLALKAKGFTYTIDRHENDKGQLDPAGQVKVTGSCNLIVPTVKAKSTGRGCGSTGALKSQTGLSRHELVEQYATDSEKADIAKAESEATNRPDSARYTAEKPVIKRILADNPALIKS